MAATVARVITLLLVAGLLEVQRNGIRDHSLDRMSHNPPYVDPV